MADKLIELQENIKRQERQAIGRVAAGIVHDPRTGPEHRQQHTSAAARRHRRRIQVEPHATIERELTALRRFMDDLRNVGDGNRSSFHHGRERVLTISSSR
jgi:hypothetical protein